MTSSCSAAGSSPSPTSLKLKEAGIAEIFTPGATTIIDHRVGADQRRIERRV